jgi:hypothetical protein
LVTIDGRELPTTAGNPPEEITGGFMRLYGDNHFVIYLERLRPGDVLRAEYGGWYRQRGDTLQLEFYRDIGYRPGPAIMKDDVIEFVLYDAELRFSVGRKAN